MNGPNILIARDGRIRRIISGDRVYYVTEDCFKFYKFIDAESDKAYDEAISYFKSHTNYDTGLTAKRGDKLITLVTCASHTDNGRFVVVAREKRS